MPFSKHNIPSEQVTLSRALTNIPPITLADTAKTPAYTAAMAVYTSDIVAYIPNNVPYTAAMAAYITDIVAYTAETVPYTPDIAAYKSDIAPYTPDIVPYITDIGFYITATANYITADVAADKCNRALSSKISTDMPAAINKHEKSPKGLYNTIN